MSSAVVTGASSGIGEATARLLADRGFRLILVARRADRLAALAESLPDAHAVAVDVTDPESPATVRAAVEDRFGGDLSLLVNNAGASWRAAFGDPDGGFANVERTMAVNFSAGVRLTEALLPILRASAPSAIVNVSSVAARVARPRTGAYAASKAALAAWTDALQLEEAAGGVHVGLVLPGFVATEGFPQRPLVENPATRWVVSRPERVAQAIYDAGPGGRGERVVPRGYAVFGLMRLLVPALVRRLGAGSGGFSRSGPG